MIATFLRLGSLYTRPFPVRMSLSRSLSSQRLCRK
jgi:hypothetical protein